eukprot:scaffold171266_cov23-Tisochrysis_lutea.AAC.3
MPVQQVATAPPQGYQHATARTPPRGAARSCCCWVHGGVRLAMLKARSEAAGALLRLRPCARARPLTHAGRTPCGHIADAGGAAVVGAADTGAEGKAAAGADAYEAGGPARARHLLLMWAAQKERVAGRDGVP